MADKTLNSRISPLSQVRFRWARKCFDNRNKPYTGPLYAMLKKPTAQIAHLVFADIPITIGTNAGKTKRAVFCQL